MNVAQQIADMAPGWSVATQTMPSPTWPQKMLHVRMERMCDTCRAKHVIQGKIPHGHSISDFLYALSAAARGHD